jgi:hypothetical protein
MPMLNLPVGVAGWAALQQSLGSSGWAELQKEVDALMQQRPDMVDDPAPPGVPDLPGRRRNHAAAVAAFKQMVPVLTHPRCANCHSPMTFFNGEDDYAGDGSRDSTGDFRRIPGTGTRANHPGGPLTRVPDSPANRTGMTLCRECHEKAPPQWDIGPSWEGLTAYQLCQSMKAARNDGEQFLEHVRTDALVKLAFQGMKAINNKTPHPPPLSHVQFLGAATDWIAYMDAMKKFPKARSDGCPRDDSWSGAVEYTYTEVTALTKFESHGMIHVVGGRGKWSGLAARVEDHSAKGCPSVYNAASSGDGETTLVTLDHTSEKPITGFSVPDGRASTNGGNARQSANAMLTIFPDRYAFLMELPLQGSGTYTGGGPACPGYKPVVQEFNLTINANADGTFDPDNPDELSGTKTTAPFPGASMTMKWQFMRLNEAR